MTAQITTFPGQTAARNALSDPKTTPEVRRIAISLTGDVAAQDLLWAARGADYFAPKPVDDDAPTGAAAVYALLFAMGVTLVMFGWVLGLLTVLFTLQ